jgi:chromosome segregation ATPase
MERNRWETAIRCLEVALHPHTNDEEVIAGVNGFRRTADGTPLSEVCIEFAGKDYDGYDSITDSARRTEKFDRLNRENTDLRRELEIEASSRIIALRRVQETERRVRDLSEKLLAAHRRASDVEQQFADFRSAHAQMAAGVNPQKFEPARHTLAEQEAQTMAPPFRKFLDAARQRGDHAEAAFSHHTAAPARGRESSGSSIFGPSQRTPWTA